ncbi:MULTISPECIES: PHB depolymerase family esterase [unclassified Amycolatopsis]|uniref:extracellular catalytic domain type 1 short-chain-length polyhydroxyalkanoate depolymerase n=1 Tax=unclassified Amycolatopsis TaxID=2618356 RepID=UPI002874DD9F|nr:MULTISPECIES: PHB depolymerase family esterase [unclassified Amycolatopsis]MDS0135623.1 PHB depolymerase family esterase [Amycolatopsis sp. 505]MDS0148361.1 PHB depolymerase family esterase [Amycolatopsis sp. CM201R]
MRKLAFAGLAAITAAVLTTVGVAAADPPPSSLVQVPNFGTNPGNLAMYTYTPAGLGTGRPVVVALHGCTQSAADYYAHSGWPELADRWRFEVVFPQTSTANNSLKCFTWFDPADDTRGKGEAASIKSMVDKAVADHGSDTARVFVTGLSAGGGMAADLLAAYPDVFAGGGINAGLPAQCATSITQASGCQQNDQHLTPAQWAAKVKAQYPGYGGPWPRVAIWQGAGDYTVAPVNGTELRDQWTAVHGVAQTPTSTQSLPGGTTLTTYADKVQLYSIAGMGHGTAVDPGTGSTQCGSTGAYFLAGICSSYYTGVFFGLDNGSGTPPPTTTTSTTTTAQPGTCVNASNYAHTQAGRAHQSGGQTYANGSNQAMGLWNTFTIHALRETSPGYWVLADGQC